MVEWVKVLPDRQSKRWRVCVCVCAEAKNTRARLTLNRDKIDMEQQQQHGKLFSHSRWCTESERTLTHSVHGSYNVRIAKQKANITKIFAYKLNSYILSECCFNVLLLVFYVKIVKNPLYNPHMFLFILAPLQCTAHGLHICMMLIWCTHDWIDWMTAYINETITQQIFLSGKSRQNRLECKKKQLQ